MARRRAVSSAPEILVADDINLIRCVSCRDLHLLCDTGEVAVSADMSTDEWVDLFIQDPEFVAAFCARARKN